VKLAMTLELERIYGGPEAEPSVWRVDVRFYLRAYDKDDALQRLIDEVLPDTVTDKSDPQKIEWEYVDSEESELLE
jgi:hypothetical protein